MQITYKTYEPGQGYEAKQAALYSALTGRQVTATEITKRYEDEAIDPLTVRYAFGQDGQLLGYCQARDYPDFHETHIGYPWTAPECPANVKHALFDDLYAYARTRTVGYPIKINAANIPKIVGFAREKGFIEESRFYYYFFSMEDILQLPQPSNDGPYQAQKATLDDLSAICAVYISLRAPFGDVDDPELVDYMQKAIQTGRATVLIAGDHIVGFQILLADTTEQEIAGKKECVQAYGITLLTPQHMDGIKNFLSQAIVENKTNGWGNTWIRLGASSTNAAFHTMVSPLCSKSEIITYKMVPAQ
jgi:hypothetical protein